MSKMRDNFYAAFGGGRSLYSDDCYVLYAIKRLENAVRTVKTIQADIVAHEYGRPVPDIEEVIVDLVRRKFLRNARNGNYELAKRGEKYFVKTDAMIAKWKKEHS